MPTLNLSGKVVHGIPTDGVAGPCAGASIEVYDLDQGGDGNNLIWSGRTDTNGNFAGTSADWQDNNSVRVTTELPGHWEGFPPKWVPGGQITKDLPVPDVLLLKVIVSQQTPNGSKSQEFPFVQGAGPIPAVPLVVPWASPTTVSKNARALVVLSQLVVNGAQNWSALYRFLDTAGVMLAETILGPVYKSVTKLVGAQATKARFIDTLRTLGADSSIRAIDVILNAHGSNEKIYFTEGGVSMSTLKSDLQGLNLANKLRMIYSTACFGKSHSNEFVESGFNAACGAVGVNANSATEYPTVLTMWASGARFSDAVALGENPLTRIPADKAAMNAGFPEANSDKDIHGDGNITISS